MKKEKGIALITLIIIVIILGIVVCYGWKYATQYIYNQKKEDIKVDMMAIQGIITNIQNKHIVDEEANNLEGIELNLENNETGYQISEELKSSLLSVEEAKLYILNEEELKKHGINNVKINNTEFYVVDYNSGEVFYSIGIEGKYKLSEM